MQLNRRAFVGASAALAAATHGAASSTGAGNAAQRRALDRLTHYVEQHRADWGLPGMTVCVADRDGYTGVIRSGFAHIERREAVRAEHTFQIGSITKMMVALTAWSMILEGKLAPSDKLTALMPE